MLVVYTAGANGSPVFASPQTNLTGKNVRVLLPGSRKSSGFMYLYGKPKTRGRR